MKLRKLAVSNFLGIATASAVLNDKTVHFFAGANASGKSSIAEAVRLAMTGDSLRVQHKKDYAALLHDPAQKSALVEVGVFDTILDDEPEMYRVHLPEGKRVAPLKNSDALEARLRCVIDSQRFARLDDKEKRRMLFDVMDVSFDGATVAKMMQARGISASCVESVKPMLRHGFDAACAEAGTMAREKKAAWRAITGEQWGSDKALAWAAAVPHFDAAAHERAIEKYNKAQAAYDEANRRFGALKNALDAVERARKERSGITVTQADLDSQRATLAVYERAYEDAKKHSDGLRANLSAAQEGADADAALICPCCEASLLLLDGKLSDIKKLKTKAGKAEIAALRERVANADKEREKRASMVIRAKQNVTDYTRALERANVLDEQIAKGSAPRAIDEAASAVSNAKVVRDEASNELAALNRAKDDAAQAGERTKKALKLHEEIGEWLAVADALAPTGIPSELLAAAFEPLNSRLLESATLSEWPIVKIHPDMLITFGGRPYSLLSESEKWRTDAMIADAIAHFSGLKLLVLDRADVLDSANRQKLVGWLYNIAEDYDTILVFATLRERPDLPAEFGVHWIEGGVLDSVKAAA